MKTFEELFQQAERTADHRKKVFNDLIEKTKNEILPGFCAACRKYDINGVYGKLVDVELTNQFSLDTSVRLDEVEVVYPFYIDVQNETIEECNLNLGMGYDRLYDADPIGIENLEIKRNAIIQFVGLLNSRLEAYNRQYGDKNKRAEKLLNQ